MGPEEEVDLKPHALQRAALVGMTALVLISFSIANLQSIIWFSSDWLVSTILPAVVTDATNEARAAEGRAPLSRNSFLDEAARLKAEDMALNGYFAHWSPTGVSPWHWFGAAGYAYAHAGENLAVHFTDSTAVVDAWLDSPTHRANIMSDRYTEIGIGTAKGRYEGFDTVFVVQMFGTPVANVSAPTAIDPAAPVEAEEETATIAPPIVAGVETDTSVGVTDDGTVVYESFAATTADNVEQLISSTEGKTITPPSALTRVLTSPRLMLQIAYTIIGVLVALALIASIMIEWRRHHPVQIAYATALLLFMMVLFEVHLAVSRGVTIA